MKIYSIIFILTLFIACRSEVATETEIATDSDVVTLSDAQLKNADLKAGTLVRKSISSTIRLNGAIEVPPQNMISISVPLGGYLKMTKLLPGMHISKGETIAIIEDQQYIQLQQDYLTSKARLAFAEKEYERQTDLNQSKAGSDKVLQQAQADFLALKIEQKSLSEKLELIGIHPAQLNENSISRFVHLRSPINGYVTKVNFNVGKYINPADVLFELVNQSDIHLSLAVFEKQLDQLYIGQKLYAYTNSNPDKKYLCEIILIGKTFAADKSVQVHCHFMNYHKSLISGMYMNAELELKSKEVQVLPNESIVHFEDKEYVFKKEGTSHFKMTEVQTGSNENGFTEIISEKLAPNDSIVIKGAYTLLMTLKNTEE